MAATMCASKCAGMGGDKFEIQWAFQDVSIVPAQSMEQKTEVNAFQNCGGHSQRYIPQVSEDKYDVVNSRR